MFAHHIRFVTAHITFFNKTRSPEPLDSGSLLLENNFLQTAGKKWIDCKQETIGYIVLKQRRFQKKTQNLVKNPYLARFTLKW